MKDLFTCPSWDWEIQEVGEDQMIEEIIAKQFPILMKTINPWF